MPPALSQALHQCYAQADDALAHFREPGCWGMMRYNESLHLSSAADALPLDHVRLAASAYLARFTGSSREHTESDLRCYLRWCADRGLDPLAARRPDPEQYIRWMRNLPVQALHHLAAVLGDRRVLPHLRHRRRARALPGRARPPTECPGRIAHARVHPSAVRGVADRPRESANDYDFALVAMLGLLGLRIFEATGADIGDLGEEHGHRVLRVCGKGTKVVLVPLPPAVGRAIDRAVANRASGPILLNRRGTRIDRHAATRRLRHLAQHGGVRISRPHPHMITSRSQCACSTRQWPRTWASRSSGVVVFCGEAGDVEDGLGPGLPLAFLLVGGVALDEEGLRRVLEAGARGGGQDADGAGLDAAAADLAGGGGDRGRFPGQGVQLAFRLGWLPSTGHR